MTVKAIRKFLDNPDAVIFVGSGASRWSGLPSWEGLIEELAKYLEDAGKDASLIRREAQAGDLLQAASYGFDKLGPQSVGEFIRGATRLGSAKPSALHKAIVHLGPACFITTNYDNLVEQALALWRPEEFFRPAITNTQLSSLVEILSARASHFVFKPHGDASDSSSIILTREQYRVLMPGGERHSALEALKTLLVTRPILYVGFGLRDPDFMFIKDVILNTFRGNTREHIAIVSNIDDSQSEYWSRNYGIRLHNYDAPARDDGTEDHSELLQLVEALQASQSSVIDDEAQLTDEDDERRILSLARYSAGVARLKPEIEQVEIRISRYRQSDRVNVFSPWEYEHWHASRFLTDGPSQGILVGLPGAGKSFSLKAAAADLAKKLQDHILDSNDKDSPSFLPIFIDLKLYQGSLSSQISSGLPPSYTIDELRGSLRIKLFLDAYNEMPSIYVEDGSFNEDLVKLTAGSGDIDFIISSRTTDGISHLGIPTYELSQFDPDYVELILNENRIELEGTFEEDVKRLLARPFFLGLLKKGSIDLAGVSRPRDIYESYIKNLEADWKTRMASAAELSPALSRLAFHALDDGREAFPIAWVTDHLAPSESIGQLTDDADIVNWLIAKGVLIPYSGARVSFIHQSITEYLAAIEVVKLNRAGSLSIRDLVGRKKWDQCLFLAISLMAQEESDIAMSYLIKADLSLALNAVRFAEDGQEAFISAMLESVCELAATEKYDHGGSYMLGRVPFTERHVEHLERISAMGGTWGAGAVSALGRLTDYKNKAYLFRLLNNNLYDFNFIVNGLVHALGDMLEPEDLDTLVQIIVTATGASGDELREQDAEDRAPLVGELLAHFAPGDIMDKLGSNFGPELPPIVRSLVCRAFGDLKDRHSFNILLDMVLKEQGAAIYPLYSRIRFKGGDNYLADITDDHIESLWRLRGKDAFSVRLIRSISQSRSDLRATVAALSDGASAYERVAILWCVSTDSAKIFAETERLLDLSDDEFEDQDFGIFPLSDLDWGGREATLVSLLARKNWSLAEAILGGGTPCDVDGLGRLSLGQINPLLDWIADSVGNKEIDIWKCRQLGSLIARHGDESVRIGILKILDAGPTEMRTAVKNCVLPFMIDLSTDHLSENAISLLMSELSQPNIISTYFYNPLGTLATERFVEQRLIPLAQGASKVLARNLAVVLSAAGDQHGRRYLLVAQ